MTPYATAAVALLFASMAAATPCGSRPDGLFQAWNRAHTRSVIFDVGALSQPSPSTIALAGGTDVLHLNVCQNAKSPCYPTTCADEGVMHRFKGPPCLPWNATVNSGSAVVFKIVEAAPPATGTPYNQSVCGQDYNYPCEQQACYGTDGSVHNCTASCNVVADTAPTSVSLQGKR